MGLITNFFGPTEFQNEFQKAHSLNWVLITRNMRDVEFSFGNSIAKQNFTDSSLEFNFFLGFLLIKGSLVDEVFNYRGEFHIVMSKLQSGDLTFYLSFNEDNNIIMTCKVKRGHLLFEGTRSNWYLKMFSDKMFCYVQ
jgi:hypothetical protein